MASSATTGGGAAALNAVLDRVQRAADRSGRDVKDIRVVAASKTKGVSALRQVYDAGHRCFGENYVQEIIEKAPQLPDDIEWHFIGNLQSNKVKPLLAGVPNLAYVETVDDEKIANLLERAVGKIGRKPLKVFVEVNTSGETSKFGVEPTLCVDLVKHIVTNCPNLEFSGLMTIGMLDYSSTPENFKTLSKCRSEVCAALGISEAQIELSMGMTADFEQAIEMGSTTVRIGTAIFGLPYKTLAFFKAAYALYDAEFYVKADDDIYLRPDRLSLLLAKDRSHSQTYIGCMKKGPVFTDPKLKWYEPLSHLLGKEYFLHAYGPIYALSANVVSSLVVLRNDSFRMFSNEDVTIGAWMLAMNVNHENNHQLCASDCTPKSIAVWDIPKCSGLCNPEKKMLELHQKESCSQSPTLESDDE